jgi:CheY-like chemotaxis protein
LNEPSTIQSEAHACQRHRRHEDTKPTPIRERSADSLVRAFIETNLQNADKLSAPRTNEMSSHQPVPMQMNSKRILIADDEPIIREIIRMALGDGYDISEAGDGEEAWQKLSTANPPFDLAILDLKMPRFGGDEVLNRIHQLNARFPAILLTGNLAAPIPSQPHVRVILKPFNNAELAATVKELLA